MDKNHDSEILSIEYQSYQSHHENHIICGLDENIILRAESAEPTDSENAPKPKVNRNGDAIIQKEENEAESKPRRIAKVIMNISDTKYRVVEFVGRMVFNWKISRDIEGDWDIFWTDFAVQPDQLGRMKPYQKINHFPGMYSLAQKNHLGRNLMRIRKVFPQFYDFFPPTWVLPTEFPDFKAQFTKKSGKTYIIKPAASCQGRGIFLTRTWENVTQTESLVAQRYLFKPFLIDGLKFDLRIYVLLAGCDPLRIYMYEEGLVRFATVQYTHPKGDNIEDMCMHLTNYAINKGNPNFVFNENENEGGVGHKRTLTSLWQTLNDLGCNVEKLKEDIEKLIIKTFCCVQPILAHQYKACQPEDLSNSMCFEVLGFDVLLDYKLKPWLIEVNHTPSFTTDTPLDHAVKQGVIADALKLMNICPKNRFEHKKKQQCDAQKLTTKYKRFRFTPEERLRLIQETQRERDKWEIQNRGRYKKLYPKETGEATEPYKEFMKEASQHYENLMGTCKTFLVSNSNTSQAIKRNAKKEPSNLVPFRFNSSALMLQNSYMKSSNPTTEQSETNQNRQNAISPNKKPTFTVVPKSQMYQLSYPKRSLSNIPPDILKLETKFKSFDSSIDPTDSNLQGTSENACIKADTPSDMQNESTEKLTLQQDCGPIFRIPFTSTDYASVFQKHKSFNSYVNAAIQTKIETLRPNIYPVQNMFQNQNFNLEFINKQNSTIFSKIFKNTGKTNHSDTKLEENPDVIEQSDVNSKGDLSRNVISGKTRVTREINRQRYFRSKTPQQEPRNPNISFGLNLSSNFLVNLEEGRTELIVSKGNSHKGDKGTVNHPRFRAPVIMDTRVRLAHKRDYSHRVILETYIIEEYVVMYILQ